MRTLLLLLLLTLPASARAQDDSGRLRPPDPPAGAAATAPRPLPAASDAALFDDGNVRFHHPYAVPVRPVPASSPAAGAAPGGPVALLLEFSPDAFLVIERHADLPDPAAFAASRAAALLDGIARGLERAGFACGNRLAYTPAATGEAGLAAAAGLRYTAGGEPYVIECRVLAAERWRHVLCEARPAGDSSECALWARRIARDLAEPR